MGECRRAAAGAVLLLLLIGGSAIGRGREPSTADTGDRRSASVEPQALPAHVPAGNVERGRYLVHDVAMCIECHSPRDENGKIIPGQEYMGAPIPFRPPWPNDWALRAPRIGGLPGYTTDVGIRLLTQGAIDRDGQLLRPPMPRFHMNDQDAADVVAYLQSLL